MPLGDDEVNYETDKMLSRISVSFGASNQAVRVILLEIGIAKSFRNGQKLDENGWLSASSKDSFEKRRDFNKLCKKKLTSEQRARKDYLKKIESQKRLEKNKCQKKEIF